MPENPRAPRTNNVPVRLTATGFGWVEALRREYDVSRADVIRESLAVAANHRDEIERRLDEYGRKF